MPDDKILDALVLAQEYAKEAEHDDSRFQFETLDRLQTAINQRVKENGNEMEHTKTTT